MQKVEDKDTWESLKIPKELTKRLIELGFEKPYKTQTITIKESRKNSVYVSGGTGKTLSYLIPSILEVDTSIPTIKGGKFCPQVIILADNPAQLDMIDRTANLIKETVYDDVIINTIYKGEQLNQEGCHILVITVHKLRNMFNNKKNINQEFVKLLVIDETEIVIKNDFSNIFVPQLIIKGLKKEVRLILTCNISNEIFKSLIGKIQDYKNIVTFEFEKKNLIMVFTRCS